MNKNQCIYGIHTLIAVHSYRVGPDRWDVVYWCEECGSVAVERQDSSGISQGTIMPMRYPKNLGRGGEE